MNHYYGDVHFHNMNQVAYTRLGSIHLIDTNTNNMRIIRSVNRKNHTNFKSDLLTRLFRWNQCNLHITNFDQGDMIYVGAGKILSIRMGQIVSSHNLYFGRTHLRNPLCITENNYFYFADYHANKKRLPINIYKSNNEGLTWEVISPFKAGFCKHVHGIFYDRYTNSKWIATGDSDSESHICTLANNDQNYDTIGGGSQLWRTCHLFFREDSVFWFTDSPTTQNYLIKYNRYTKEISIVTTIPGPVISAAEYEDGILASTSVEPGTKYKSSFIMYTKDFKDVKIISKFRKDKYHSIFGFGNISFSLGSKSFMDAYCFLQATEFFDQKSISLHEILGYGTCDQL